MKLHSILTEYFVKNSIVIVLVLSGIVIAFLYGFYLFVPWSESGRSEGIEVTIHRGMTPQEIAALLNEKGVIPSQTRFLFGAKLLGVTRSLQAGHYTFRQQRTNYSVLRKLSKGLVQTQYVTIPEGSRATRIASIFRQELSIDSTRIMVLVTDTAFCRSLGIEASTLEGYLYPDTYRFPLNPTTEEVLEHMVSEFREIFDDSLVNRMQQVNMSLHEVVTLASIVEGEAALDAERPIIAALYLNRLKRRMLLQADPTIQYIIKNGPRRLLNKDLQIDSPYNTYLYPGLPPGPVNNPGIASIRAVLYPASVDYLYMVANGDGSHTFSRSIENHLKAKARFDRIRRNSR